MDKKRGIELLIQAVDEIPHLKTLHYRDGEIKLWLDKVENILREGLKPEDYNKYWPVSPRIEILKGIYEDNIYQEEYLRKITDYELALKSILLKYEVVGMEGKRDKGGEVEMVRKGKMDKGKETDKVRELEAFLEEYKSYQRLLKSKGRLSDKESLREMLVRKVGALKSIIIELTGRQYVSRAGHRYEIWHTALGTVSLSSRRDDTLAFCIDAVNEAIGKLKSDIQMGVRGKQGNVIGEPPKNTAELPVNLFDKMQFHPRVIQVSESLFKTGNYASAILEAFKAVDNYVKEKTALSLNGQALMSKVFDENTPIIKLNDLLTQSDRDEQEGFKFLFKGATIGIRNSKAHNNVVQTDPYRTLEYLGLASLLMRRIEEGKLVTLLK